MCFVSGPAHLRFFEQFCMKISVSSADDSYSYTVCPYHNVTQLDTKVSDAADVAIGLVLFIQLSTYLTQHKHGSLLICMHFENYFLLLVLISCLLLLL